MPISKRSTGAGTALVGKPDSNRIEASSVGASLDCSLVWVQRSISLSPLPRGFHLVTGEILGALPEVGGIETGLLHLLIQHTSASLALSENASPEVRRDFESWFDRAVPEGADYWTHTLEGDDDMPAHVKAALLGPTLTLPIGNGRLTLGTWQGIYLCEHRDDGGSRSVIATAWGEAPDR